ncbi:hypothetical protein FACS1894211_03820 [Clostridia bacterium]|nr:hypothetical protein FACS1894211_03820 [Clostridia bacterium]
MKLEMKSKKLKNGMLTVLLPVLFGVFLLLLWRFKALHALLGLNESQLPYLENIWVFIKNGGDGTARITVNVKSTLAVVFLGLIIGSLLGYFVAVIAALFPKSKGVLTVLAAFNAIPVVALAPIMGRWFPQSAQVAKVAIAAILCLVPMSVNAYRGLTELKPYSQDLLKSYAASKTQIFLKLKLPNSVPHIFTALKLCVVSAMIGAIIGEYYISGPMIGIGKVIRNDLKGGRLTSGWSHVLIATLIGALLYAAVLLFEKYTVRAVNAVKTRMTERTVGKRTNG